MSETSTFLFIAKKRFSNIFGLNPSLKKPMGVQFSKEMSYTKTTHCFYVKCLCKTPSWNSPIFLVDSSLAIVTK